MSKRAAKCEAKGLKQYIEELNSILKNPYCYGYFGVRIEMERNKKAKELADLIEREGL